MLQSVRSGCHCVCVSRETIDGIYGRTHTSAIPYSNWHSVVIGEQQVRPLYQYSLRSTQCLLSMRSPSVAVWQHLRPTDRLSRVCSKIQPTLHWSITCPEFQGNPLRNFVWSCSVPTSKQTNASENMTVANLWQK